MGLNPLAGLETNAQRASRIAVRVAPARHERDAARIAAQNAAGYSVCHQCWLNAQRYLHTTLSLFVKSLTDAPQ
jgi:hypothetical protein